MPTAAALTDLPPRRAGYALEREWYLSDAVYARDIERIFMRSWLFAAPLAAFRHSGDYVTLTIGDAPIFLLRGADGEIRAFHNVCRHRGSRLFSAEFGNMRGGKIVCPYHQWAYQQDGALHRASHMPEQPDAATHSLLPIRAATFGGGVHVRLGGEDDNSGHFAAEQIGAHTRFYDGDHKIAHHTTHLVNANWKLAVENNRECGHCRGAHPELMSCVFDFGMGADSRQNNAYAAAEKQMQAACAAAGITAPTLDFPNDSFFRVARLPFRRGFQSETTGGGAACRKPLGSAPPQTGQLRVVALPNCWSHYLPDYYVVTRLLPLAAEKTRLDVYWITRADAKEGEDYDLATLTEVWEQTTRQDARLIEENHAGVRSPAYRPGPYSPITETLVEHFAHWYCTRL